MRRFCILIALAALTAAGWPTDGRAEAPGKRFHVRPQDMPEPYASESVGNSPDIVPRRASWKPTAPDGYRVNLFAGGLDHARWLLAAPSGEVFLAEPRRGKVTLLIDNDRDGVADAKHTFADGLETPHGLALRDGHLYVADVERVWRFDWRPGRTEAAGDPEPVTPRGALGEPYGHWTRNIAIAPDGAHFYVAIGSQGNIAVEPEPRATIKRFDIDGRNGAVFASGLRNPVGIAFHPDTGILYTAVNERDGLGDALVPDYFTAVREGGFYGWPYAYIGSHPQPGFADKRPDLVRKAIVPDTLFQSHSAPMAIQFAKGGDFPRDWQDDAFVAFRGSWNAAVPRGYKVVRVIFENGRPTGAYENFLTGFRRDEAGARGPATVWGRPVGLALLPDGSLLVAADEAQEIWRVSREK